MTISLPIIYALIAMVFLGVMAIILKLTTNYISPIQVMFLHSVTMAVLVGLFMAFFPQEKLNLTLKVYCLVFAGALIASIGFFSYLTALKLGEVNVVAPIRNLSLLVSVLAAVLFLSEKLTLTKIIGIFLAVVAILLLSI